MKKLIFAVCATLMSFSPMFFSAAQAERDALTVGMILEPPHLDPTAGAAAAIDEVVYANLFEGLTRIDENGTVRPALATSWTISADGKVYTFALASGVKFHDGTSFTSADAVFSLNRAMADDSENAQKALFSNVDSVAADGDESLVITLKEPAGNFLFNLGWGDAVIVAEESAATNKNKPVGTGPFKFDRWVNGDRVELKRNEAYWGTQAALASATFKFISDPNAAMAALMAEEVDAFANFPAPELVPVFQADPRFAVVQGSTEGETILSTNNGKEPWSNPLVRQALAHTIDRQAIIDGAMYGFGTPIGTHFAPHNEAYLADLINTYPHDLEKAKALLAEAGYADGIKGVMKLPPPSYARRGGEIIAAQLAQVGIEMEIVPVEWGQWLSDVFKATDYDLTIVSHTEPMDIGIYARDTYYFNYQSDEMKSLIAALEIESDPAKRTALMQQAQTLITTEAVNTYLFQLAKVGVWNAKVQGLWKNSPVQANDITGVSWTD
ncbi:MAG: ABC transporter substrate-binding protein [Alphaproteobacteria bacterium]